MSFESRYGMCVACVERAFITFDTPSSDVLMLIASFIRLPLVSSSAPERLTRSRPRFDNRRLAPSSAPSRAPPRSPPRPTKHQTAG